MNTKRPRTEKRLGKEDFFLHTFWVTLTQNYIGYRRHLSLWKIPQIILGLKSQPLYIWLRYSCELMNVPLFSLPMDIMCAFTFLIENDLFSAAKQGICLMDVYSEKLWDTRQYLCWIWGCVLLSVNCWRKDSWDKTSKNSLAHFLALY